MHIVEWGGRNASPAGGSQLQNQAGKYVMDIAQSGHGVISKKS